jgi:hypothetical protein
MHGFGLSLRTIPVNSIQKHTLTSYYILERRYKVYMLLLEKKEEL